MNRKFEARDATSMGIEDDGRVVIWMVDTFDPPTELDVVNKHVPLMSIYTHNDLDSKALVAGIMSMLTTFGLPDSNNPRQFAEIAADKSITGR